MSKRTLDSEIEGRPLLSATAWKQVAAAYVHEDGTRVSQDAVTGCMAKLEDGKRVRSSFGSLDGDKRVGTDVGFGSDVNGRSDAVVAFHTADLLFQNDEIVQLKRDEDEDIEDVHGRADGLKDDVARSRNLALQKSISQGVRQAQLLQQQQILLSQAPTVLWERFLPQRQLRVLLAEDDDSTRHVVTALLRNCSYEVTSAANGLLAWELLIAQTVQVDLVLTEVVMPCLSGIGLMSRIVSHQAFKHIPVIMMSSHDSMSIVFKCLSRGAVDFLVKPVRKNELKNLWQHVWRRCHSSSGSGSGSGSQTQKASRSEGAADCNNSGSMDENDNASSDLNVRGGSDNGSGTQGSWTKGIVEVESSHPEKNCAPSSNNLENEGFDVVFGKDVEATLMLAAAGPSSIQEYTVASACALPLKCPDATSGKDIGSGSSQEGSPKAIDLIGVIASKENGDKKEEQAESRDEDMLEKHASNSLSSKEKGASDSGSPALLELTLKRPRQFEDDNKDRDGRHVLRHSCSSAFSRYNNANHQTPLISGNTSSTQQCKHGSHPSVLASDAGSNGLSFAPLAATGAGSPVPIVSHAYQTASRQEKTFPTGKDCVSVKEEADSINHNASSAGQTQFPVPPGGAFYDGIPHCFAAMNHPMFHGGAALPSQPPPLPPPPSNWGSSANLGEAEVVHVSYDEQHIDQASQVHHHSHKHSHHHHHHVQHHYHYHQQMPKQQQKPVDPKSEEQTVSNVGAMAPICGSSNMVTGQEGVLGQSGSSNGNGNASATGSNNGSNAHSNAQSGVAQTTPIAPGDAGNKIVNGGGSGNGSMGTGFAVAHVMVPTPEQTRFARREAALTKFRQKRKERCFEKKVRYQSRKRLAEQRPRVRGQFVRQSVYESTAGELE